MRTLVLFALMLGCVGCEAQKSAPKQSSTLRDREDSRIHKAKKDLVSLGRMDAGFSDDFIVLGRYAWHSDGKSGYFGAYSFYSPAFEQAKRGWFLETGRVLEGSNELWTSSETLKFDKTVIGYKLPSMYMVWFVDGKYSDAWFTANIVGVKDDGKTLVLDKRAPHHAEQWHIAIVPNDWVNMCDCTNNFGPQFFDGHPIVEQ